MLWRDYRAHAQGWQRAPFASCPFSFPLFTVREPPAPRQARYSSAWPLATLDVGSGRPSEHESRRRCAVRRLPGRADPPRSVSAPPPGCRTRGSAHAGTARGAAPRRRMGASPPTDGASARSAPTPFGRAPPRNPGRPETASLDRVLTLATRDGLFAQASHAARGPADSLAAMKARGDLRPTAADRMPPDIAMKRPVPAHLQAHSLRGGVFEDEDPDDFADDDTTSDCSWRFVVIRRLFWMSG